jgi:hypothetical protein
MKLFLIFHVHFTVFDSSAKFPSGVLNGNTNQYGDFDQCLDVATELDPLLYSHLEHYRIAGKYCLALLDLEVGNTSRASRVLKELDDLMHAHRPIVSTLNDVSDFYRQCFRESNLCLALRDGRRIRLFHQSTCSRLCVTF